MTSMKKTLSILTFFIMFFSLHSCTLAVNSPTLVPNNKFGIHITSENDLKKAADLVNSSGGDWGYVTFVITEKERDYDRWQKAFDQARRLHLIPIVRIATKAEGENWTIPSEDEIDNWVNFLSSLNWVIQNRYVIIGNEPNHAKEWGGTLDPAAYASYLKKFSLALKKDSTDYFVMVAGMDASANNSKDTMDEALYLKKMFVAEPNLFENIDGLSSHSYPNPGFAGKATDKGRGSIYTYDWELSYLSQMGVSKNLPVFITETGWSNEKVPTDLIADLYKYAFENVWDDPRVVAVTPFILDYSNPPFAEFSWIMKNGKTSPYYDVVKNIIKIQGKPTQIESGQILGALAQPIVFTGSDFIGAILVRNTGQSIWNTDNIQIISDDGQITFKNSLHFDIEPNHTALIIFKASTEQTSGVLIKSVYFKNQEGKRITNNFPIEALIVKANKGQLKNFFTKATESISENE